MIKNIASEALSENIFCSRVFQDMKTTNYPMEVIYLLSCEKKSIGGLLEFREISCPVLRVDRCMGPKQEARPDVIL
jgi:hypothetical protein